MPGPDVEDLRTKAALAKSILDDVVDSSSHEDEKVGRMLYSMSFLTVGATIAFSAFIGNRIGRPFYELDLVSAFFVAYVLFLVSGTTVILEAMSPRLYLPRGRSRDEGPVSSADLDSRHFFKSVARKERESWVSSFQSSTGEELLAREADDCLRQAHFLSRKVTEKIDSIRKAKWFMILAALCFLAMSAVGVASYI